MSIGTAFSDGRKSLYCGENAETILEPDGLKRRPGGERRSYL